MATSTRWCVWLAWGKFFLAEAERSRASTANFGYHSLLITDQASLDQVSDGALNFDQTTVVDFTFPPIGNLRKTEIWRWLPCDRGPLLLIDTDTHMLREVNYGFAQAERFGLACTLAVNDTLEYFMGGGLMMKRVGVEPTGQPIYNSGVVFIDPANPVLWNTLKRREALARLLGGRTDQPSLVLAVDHTGLNPFVLPKSFNYRGSGELISEPIRIWHCRKPMPEDITDPLTWHLRRFGHISPEREALSKRAYQYTLAST